MKASNRFCSRTQALILLHILVLSHAIWLSLNYFKNALHQRYHPCPTEQRLVGDFMFAATCMHELAHVWNTWCRPKQYLYGPEPLVTRSDPFPEVGFSWENFMFGGSPVPDCEIRGTDDRPAYLYCKVPFEEGNLMSYIPNIWISQWFLRDAWERFDDLHRAGKPMAPTIKRNTVLFTCRRYCSSHGRCVSLTYFHGMGVYICCSNQDCNGREPGKKQRWPADPTAARKRWREVWANDQRLMAAAGIKYNSYDSYYDDLKKLMLDKEAFAKLVIWSPTVNQLDSESFRLHELCIFNEEHGQ